LPYLDRASRSQACPYCVYHHNILEKQMPVVLFTAVTALVLLVGDVFMIPLVMRPLFQSALGSQMLDALRLGPAALFYLIHTGGLVYFAGLPAMRGGTNTMAFINGAILGFVTYSCYEMTSWTIMRDWSVWLVVVDLAWGTCISGLATWLAALVTDRKTVVSS
jgi:uncharacterized membrane protein